MKRCLTWRTVLRQNGPVCVIPIIVRRRSSTLLYDVEAAAAGLSASRGQLKRGMRAALFSATGRVFPSSPHRSMVAAAVHSVVCADVTATAKKGSERQREKREKGERENESDS